LVTVSALAVAEASVSDASAPRTIPNPRKTMVSSPIPILAALYAVFLNKETARNGWRSAAHPSVIRN
jgi:hypothetical protein